MEEGWAGRRGQERQGRLGKLLSGWMRRGCRQPREGGQRRRVSGGPSRKAEKEGVSREMPLSCPGTPGGPGGWRNAWRRAACARQWVQRVPV